MTLEQIRAAGGGRVDRAQVAATTEEDIRQHMIEDGQDPDGSPAAHRPVPAAALRALAE
jgi:putative transcriptional regulator